jgi:periplasmic divalent cation tolerance protein
MTDKVVVLVTCGTRREAARLARAVVRERLAACVNVVRSPVHSTYRWKGKVETANEVLLLMKTSRRRFAALARAVKRRHSYDVPEVIAVPVERGSREYLAWLADCLAPPRKGKRR